MSSNSPGAGDSLTATASPQNLTSPTYAWTVTLDASPFASGNGQTLTVTPERPGALVFSVTATGAGGASATNSASVQVVSIPPTATLIGAPFSGQVASSISFQASASDRSTADTFTFAWDFGDGSTPATGASVTHSYSNAGTFNVTLTVTDSFGQTASANTTATISGASAACTGPWRGIPQLGTSSQVTEPSGVAVDVTGNVYIVGTVSGTNDASFLVKYNRCGTLVWQKNLDANDPWGVTTDSAGFVYVVGDKFLAFDPNNPSLFKDSYFVTKLDPNGNEVWRQESGITAGISDFYALGVAVDSTGRIYICGTTSQSLNGALQTGLKDYFVIAYDGGGKLLWTRQNGVPNLTSYAQSIAVDTQGGVYVVGYTGGYVGLQPTNWGQGLSGNTQKGDIDEFFAKYDASGNLVYLIQNGVAGAFTDAKGVAVNSFGEVYIAGGSTGPLDGSSYAQIPAYFVEQRRASDGSLIWERQAWPPSSLNATAIAKGVAVDGAGNAYLAGETYGPLPGDQAVGPRDYFVVSYTRNGTLMWSQQNGIAARLTNAQAVAADAAGNVFATGFSDGLFNDPTSPEASAYSFVAKYVDGVLQ